MKPIEYHCHVKNYGLLIVGGLIQMKKDSC